jgi:hypothetical protein
LYQIIKAFEEYTKKDLYILEIKSPYLIHKVVSVLLNEDKETITFTNIENKQEFFLFNNEELKNFLEDFKKRNEAKTIGVYKISIVNRLNKNNLIEYNQNSFSIELF